MDLSFTLLAFKIELKLFLARTSGTWLKGTIKELRDKIPFVKVSEDYAEKHSGAWLRSEREK